MSSIERIVIVGAGQAGGRAAQALRQAGYTGSLILVGDERWAPYERPPLSKALILANDGHEKVRLHDPTYYGQHNIDLRLGAVAARIDRVAKRLELADGTTLPYDRLMLATGARVRKLAIPGAELNGIFYLRDLADSESIRTRISAGVKVAVIGGGFIGLEIAASAKKRGAEVTVLEAADRLMGRAVAREIGDWFAGMHRRHGVDIRLGVQVKAIEGADKVEAVALGDGAKVAADLVIVGIGIVPNVELAKDAGLTIDNGIVVDEFGRTSDPDIYAAGDVANQPNHFLGRRLRLESYQNAQDQGMAVAVNMIDGGAAGAPKAYEDSLWVWSDQHDVNLQMTGAPDSWDEIVYRGDTENGPFMAFYMKQGRIVAINTINLGREMRAAQRLMKSGKTYASADLANPEIKLLKLGKD